MKAGELITHIENDSINTSLVHLYGSANMRSQKRRYAALLNEFIQKFDDRDCSIFSASGRAELGGNHTDHNNGKVLAAGIHLDAVAAASPSEDDIIQIYSEGFEEIFSIDLSILEPVETEKETTNALIRGVAAGLQNAGHKIGGFKAAVTSSVLRGSGLSSSAAFEVLIGTVLNHIYNDGNITAIEIAKISQYAENRFFGKPCGLMDQTACALGRMAGIDFRDAHNPAVDILDFSFKEHCYSLMIVDTGGSHADLTGDYASVPQEMYSVAHFFGKQTCREISYNDILSSMKSLREQAGDRSVLRALHYLKENERVDKMVSAIKNDDITTFFQLVNESGRSSFQYLQNIYSANSPHEQGISLGLALTDNFLKGEGAYRIQGGGFAGTIQAYVPTDLCDEYITLMEQCFGPWCVSAITIRPEGACKVV